MGRSLPQSLHANRSDTEASEGALAFFCAGLIPMRLHPPLNQSPAVSPRPTLVSTPHNVNYTDCTKGYP
jgi:hypothetical protein